MMSDTSEFDGLLDFSKALEEYAKVSDNVMEEEEKIAQDFVKDLLKLPSPKSKISKSGYTHLISTFSYRKKATEIEIGWGKYYGPMVEKGTIKMISSHPHLVPLWNRNSKRYIESLKKRNNL